MGGLIDYFALALSHALLLLMTWRLVLRPDLDNETAGGAGPAQADAPARRFGRRRD